MLQALPIHLLLSELRATTFLPDDRVSISTAQAIPDRGVLSIVGFESGMMNGVMRGTVHAGDTEGDTIMDIYGPTRHHN